MKALSEYTQESNVELSFNEDDIIIVAEEHESGWWKGQLNGRTGLFPVNFTEFLDNEGVMTKKQLKYSTLETMPNDQVDGEDGDELTLKFQSRNVGSIEEQLKEQRKAKTKEEEAIDFKGTLKKTNNESIDEMVKKRRQQTTENALPFPTNLKKTPSITDTTVQAPPRAQRQSFVVQSNKQANSRTLGSRQSMIVLPTQPKVVMCEACEKNQANVYCAEDKAHFCDSCDIAMHSANKIVARHNRKKMNTPSNSQPKKEESHHKEEKSKKKKPTPPPKPTHLPDEAEKTEKVPEKGGIKKKLVRAREGFAAIQPTELSLKLGDIVTLLYDSQCKDLRRKWLVSR